MGVAQVVERDVWDVGAGEVPVEELADRFGVQRAPDGVFLLRHADGISVVVNVNSNEADPADIKAVASAVHDIAAAARGPLP